MFASTPQRCADLERQVDANLTELNRKLANPGLSPEERAKIESALEAHKKQVRLALDQAKHGQNGEH